MKGRVNKYCTVLCAILLGSLLLVNVQSISNHKVLVFNKHYSNSTKQRNDISSRIWSSQDDRATLNTLKDIQHVTTEPSPKTAELYH